MLDVPQGAEDLPAVPLTVLPHASTGGAAESTIIVQRGAEIVAVLETNTSKTILLYGVFPNPFNPSTTIDFQLYEPTSVDLRILDVGGRLVRALENGRVMDAGRNQVEWNGLDDRGRPVASGTYVIRIEAGSIIETRAMVLVR